MDIRPQDLPELRAETIDHQVANLARMQWLWQQAEDAGFAPSVALDLAKMHIGALNQAELFWVSPNMCELAATAGQSLTTFTLDQADLPSRNGFIVFADPLPGSKTWPSGEQSGIRGLWWSVLGGGGGMVVPYYDRPEESTGRSGMPHLLCNPPEFFGFAYQDGEWMAGGGSRSLLLPFLIAAWLLMQQPLADVQEVEADRAARKRLRRIGQEPASVRVIELRRPKHTGGEPGENGRTYTHRWITRGHWRQQWYPARQVHRPVWIAPHVKGPEGAPMIGGEKVYAWKR